jgi:hypothetical protein
MMDHVGLLFTLLRDVDDIPLEDATASQYLSIRTSGCNVDVPVQDNVTADETYFPVLF